MELTSDKKATNYRSNNLKKAREKLAEKLRNMTEEELAERKSYKSLAQKLRWSERYKRENSVRLIEQAKKMRKGLKKV